LESASDYLYRAEVPGLSSKDLDVQVEGQGLTISGEVADELYFRQLPVPEDVDSGAVTATLERGVLSLRLPKKAASLPRQIAISTG